MSRFALWQAAPRWKRSVVVVGLAVCLFIIVLSFVHASWARVRPSLIVAAALAVLSLGLLLEGYRPVKPPSKPFKPMHDANEAAMPVPQDPPSAAVSGRGV